MGTLRKLKEGLIANFASEVVPDPCTEQWNKPRYAYKPLMGLSGRVARRRLQFRSLVSL